MIETRKKRSRRALDAESAARNSSNNFVCMNRKGLTNRKLFSAAALTLASLVVAIEPAAVVAFTPNLSGRATRPVSSSIIDNKNNKDTALKISPLTTKRRRRRQGSVSSTVVDGDSTSTSTFDASALSPSAPAASERGVSIVLDDDFFHKNSEKKSDLAVQLIFNNDIVKSPLGSKTSGKRKANIVRPKSKSPKAGSKSKAKSSLDSSSTSLLTRDEERQITYRIRDLQRVVRIRDELLQENDEYSSLISSIGGNDDAFPTEEDWAKACELDVLSLRRVMSEGQEARSLLVSANAGLVKMIAKRHYFVLKRMTTGVGTILTLQDMIQEGNLGLMKAAERFEPERGFRFSTYATYWIRQRILQSITDSSRTIRLPVHGKSKIWLLLYAIPNHAM